MICTMMLFYCLFLSFMGKLHEADGASFTTRGGTVYASNVQSADLEWEYSLNSNEALIVCYCGYLKSNNIVPMVVKTGTNNAAPVTPMPVSFKGRVSVIDENNKIGMKISGARVEDQHDYYCSLQYNRNGRLQGPLNSRILRLSIRD